MSKFATYTRRQKLILVVSATLLALLGVGVLALMLLSAFEVIPNRLIATVRRLGAMTDQQLAIVGLFIAGTLVFLYACHWLSVPITALLERHPRLAAALCGCLTFTMMIGFIDAQPKAEADALMFYAVNGFLSTVFAFTTLALWAVALVPKWSNYLKEAQTRAAKQEDDQGRHDTE